MCNCRRNKIKRNGTEAKMQRRADREAVASRESKGNDRAKKIEMIKRMWEESKNEAESDAKDDSQ